MWNCRAAYVTVRPSRRAMARSTSTSKLRSRSTTPCRAFTPHSALTDERTPPRPSVVRTVLRLLGRQLGCQNASSRIPPRADRFNFEPDTRPPFSRSSWDEGVGCQNAERLRELALRRALKLLPPDGQGPKQARERDRCAFLCVSAKLERATSRSALPSPWTAGGRRAQESGRRPWVQSPPWPSSP